MWFLSSPGASHLAVIRALVTQHITKHQDALVSSVLLPSPQRKSLPDPGQSGDGERHPPTQLFSEAHRLLSGMKITSGQGCEESVCWAACKVTLGQRRKPWLESDLRSELTREEPVPSLRLLEPRPLTSGRDSKSAAKGLHGNKANPWLPLGPGGIFKAEQAWTNRKERQARRKDWNLRLALSELCQGACLQGAAADLEAEAKTMPFGSP